MSKQLTTPNQSIGPADNTFREGHEDLIAEGQWYMINGEEEDWLRLGGANFDN